MNTVLAERSPQVHSPWASYVVSKLNEAIVNSIREKEQAGLPMRPADAPIWYLSADEIEESKSEASAECILCAVPINFRQTNAQNLGGGVLYFQYNWDSSTGNNDDLSQCTVFEEVTYPNSANFYIWPSPPWAAGTETPNPTVLPDPPAPGTGALGDYQLPLSFAPCCSNYVYAQFAAIQYFKYSCPCKNGEAPTILAGPITIVRTVQQVPPGWQYSVEKSGFSVVLPIP